MNISTFKKLQAIQDQEVLNFALFQLLDNDLWANGFEPSDHFIFSTTTSSIREGYTNLILDLMKVQKEDFNRLVEFISTNKFIRINGLKAYISEMFADDEPLPKEIFEPLLDSLYFKDELMLYFETDEILVTDSEPFHDDFTIQIFDEFLKIINFQLNQKLN